MDDVQTLTNLVVAKRRTDWAPLEAFAAVDEFERVGTLLDVQSCTKYLDMLRGRRPWRGSRRCGSV
jgi:hypothetical protein